MSNLPRSSEKAWKQRYRAPQVLTSAISWAAHTRGIAATNLSGLYQLYRWDTESGGLTQLTARPEGLVQGTVSPDGQFVYYFDDHQGEEVGHFVRLPYEAALETAPQDITPDLPLYSLASSPGGLVISRSGTRLAFLAASRTALICVLLTNDRTAHSIFQRSSSILRRMPSARFSPTEARLG